LWSCRFVCSRMSAYRHSLQEAGETWVEWSTDVPGSDGRSTLPSYSKVLPRVWAERRRSVHSPPHFLCLLDRCMLGFREVTDMEIYPAGVYPREKTWKLALTHTPDPNRPTWGMVLTQPMHEVGDFLQTNLYPWLCSTRGRVISGGGDFSSRLSPATYVRMLLLSGLSDENVLFCFHA